jgi:hypothetical protein
MQFIDENGKPKQLHNYKAAFQNRHSRPKADLTMSKNISRQPNVRNQA